MCKEKNMTTVIRKYSVFYIKLFKSTIVTRYSNMSQKDIQETIFQLPAGSIFPVVASETPYLQKVVDGGWIYYLNLQDAASTASTGPRSALLTSLISYCCISYTLTSNKPAKLHSIEQVFPSYSFSLSIHFTLCIVLCQVETLSLHSFSGSDF